MNAAAVIASAKQSQSLGPQSRRGTGRRHAASKGLVNAAPDRRNHHGLDAAPFRIRLGCTMVGRGTMRRDESMRDDTCHVVAFHVKQRGHFKRLRGPKFGGIPALAWAS
jgi:hypothetical protein